MANIHSSEEFLRKDVNMGVIDFFVEFSVYSIDAEQYG
jgi:hypothetical protein